MPDQNAPEFIKVANRLYRKAGKNGDVSKDDVKESINRAADRAALENILKNISSHGADMSALAAQAMDDVEDKGVKKTIGLLAEHAQLITLFLAELPKVYQSFVRKHGE